MSFRVLALCAIFVANVIFIIINMANLNSRANIVLSINGKQAGEMLTQLEKKAAGLEKQMHAAAQAGDKVAMKKYQRELTQTRKLMDQLRGSAATTESVLQRLDKATPKELRKALRDLERQLNNIERGSKAWEEQVEKIRQVKEELRKVKEEMQPEEGFWKKLNNWVSEWKNAIAGVLAAAAGFTVIAKNAINAYAEIDQEMANVRKFTGMTAEEVESLNEELKKIDTRTSRENLNKLAQEAGRLGKSSQEDVLGFVKAADQINVALDDLGEGATLTLSKLTDIFGEDKRLGTEKALLAVGSVINELSQNCSASAPYIAEFASRMGGVGAQAGMTVQQLMAFGAVLDANGMNVEAASTALQ